MSDTQVRLHVDGPQATVTFHTASGVNILAPDVLDRFSAVLKEVAGSKGVRWTVIAAEGKVFVAGADIKVMSAFTPDQAKGYAEKGHAVLDQVAELPSITVAAINGAALGGGLELSLACDFRIAVKSAKLGLPETSLGLIPGWEGIQRLAALIGPARAKRLFLSALPVSAEEGLSFGLVDDVVNAPEDLPPRVVAFCKSFKRGSPAAVALAKRALRSDDDITAFADCFRGPESREGMTAFVEKRPAKWME